MASFMYNLAAAELAGGLDLTTATVRALLVTDSYTEDQDHTYASTGGVTAAECSVSGYTGGYQGSSRQTIANVTVTADNTNDRAIFDTTDTGLTWSSLAAGETIHGVCLVVEDYNGSGSDANTLLVAFLDIADTPTNGGDFTINWNASGIIAINT